MPGGKEVRILHISDTHGLHESIEERFPLPAADVLIHTGDFTDMGSVQEVKQFDGWLATLRGPPSPAPSPPVNTKGYSGTYLAMGFANVRAGTWYPVPPQQHEP